MEPSEQQSGVRDQAFTLSFSQIKNRLNLLSTQFKKRPQLLLASVVGVFVLVGLVATISLVGVQQDIRQQAAAFLYSATPYGDCTKIPEGAQGCDSSNHLYACVSGNWKSIGGTCVAPTVSNPESAPASKTYSGKCNSVNTAWKGSGCPVWVIE